MNIYLALFAATLCLCAGLVLIWQGWKLSK
jgi:hypothetical protein